MTWFAETARAWTRWWLSTEGSSKVEASVDLLEHSNTRRVRGERNMIPRNIFVLKISGMIELVAQMKGGWELEEAKTWNNVIFKALYSENDTAEFGWEGRISRAMAFIYTAIQDYVGEQQGSYKPGDGTRKYRGPSPCMESRDHGRLIQRHANSVLEKEALKQSANGRVWVSRWKCSFQSSLSQSGEVPFGMKRFQRWWLSPASKYDSRVIRPSLGLLLR